MSPEIPPSMLEYTALFLSVQNSCYPAEQPQACKICKHQLQAHFKNNEKGLILSGSFSVASP